MRIKPALVLGLVLFGRCFASGESKVALLVGISDYQTASCQDVEAWSNIHGANDVELIEPLLKRRGFKVATLKNSGATATGIRQSLGKLVAECGAGDVVYLHFSCHGQPVEDLDGDEADGWDESIIPVDAYKVYVKDVYVGGNHLTDDELNRSFKEIRKKLGRRGVLNVVIDACHSGTSYRGDESEDSVFVRGTDIGFSPRGIKYVPQIDKRGMIKVESSADMSDVMVLEACRAYQVNREIVVGGRYYGALSYYISRVLGSGDVDWRGKWYESVVGMMSADPRLLRQNPVVETVR